MTTTYNPAAPAAGEIDRLYAEIARLNAHVDVARTTIARLHDDPSRAAHIARTAAETRRRSALRSISRIATTLIDVDSTPA